MSTAPTPPIGVFERAILPIIDPARFENVRSAIESAFAPARVAQFLGSLGNSGLRIRHFEDVLGRGLLGVSTREQYNKLVPGDQGQIREFYLAALERISPELRKKFFKLYAYY